MAIPVEKPGPPASTLPMPTPPGARYRGAIQTVRDAVRGGAEPEEIEVARLAPA